MRSPSLKCQINMKFHSGMLARSSHRDEAQPAPRQAFQCKNGGQRTPVSLAPEMSPKIRRVQHGLAAKQPLVLGPLDFHQAGEHALAIAARHAGTTHPTGC